MGIVYGSKVENGPQVKIGNCFITWSYTRFDYHTVSWVREFWGVRSSVSELHKRIERMENIQPNCLSCGEKAARHQHHLISNMMSIHPTKKRILDNVTIPLCHGCHSSNGGWFHNVHNTEELSKPYGEMVGEKWKAVHTLLDEIDRLSEEYELELANRVLDEIEKDSQEIKVSTK